MSGVIFLEHFNRNHLFLCAGCLINCVVTTIREYFKMLMSHALGSQLN